MLLLSSDDYLYNFGETMKIIKKVFLNSNVHGTNNTTAMFSDVENGANPGMNNMMQQLYSWNGLPNWKFPPTKEKVFMYKNESGTDFIDPRGSETFYGV